MAAAIDQFSIDLTPSEYSADCFEAAQAYVDSVLSGSVSVGRLERLAVERFASDTTDDRYRVDFDAVDRVFRFFSVLRHYKSRQFAGKQFRLSGWQAFVLLALFGLVHAETALRVFRIAYIQIARKNGKSMFAAGIALYLLTYDDEPGAEIYSAATKKDQAKIVWSDAREMVRHSALSHMLGVRDGASNIHYPEMASKFEPVGADADTLDGLNPHGVIVDELHAHKKADMWNVMLTAQGARLVSLQLAITTAGTDLSGICYEQRDYGIKVLEDIIDDPEFFAFICELDPDDDWLDEKNWRKGNPNLGVSVRVDEIRTAVLRASASPSNQNDCRTKRLNEWCEQATRWLSMDDYKACPKGVVNFAGRRCYGGLDLSSTRDFTAFVLVFPPDDMVPVWSLLPTFWMPAARLQDKELGQFRRRLVEWHRDGWLRITPGNVIDYDFVRSEINTQGELYQIQEIGYDPYNATQIVVQLGTDGFEMVKMRQGVQTLHAPCKELETLITAQQINPSPSPVMQWMASNVSVLRDSNGNMKPNRENEKLKIDGIVSTIMGLGRAIASDPEDGVSKYEKGGLVKLGA
jgi:phage terminase large subunit-like protein